MRAVVINVVSACLCFEKCARVFLRRVRAAVSCMKSVCVKAGVEGGRNLRLYTKVFLRSDLSAAKSDLGTWLVLESVTNSFVPA